MTDQQRQEAYALGLVVKAINCLLALQNQVYRVTDDDVIMSRRNGYTLMALPETCDATDWRTCGQPYSTMEKP